MLVFEFAIVSMLSVRDDLARAAGAIRHFAHNDLPVLGFHHIHISKFPNGVLRILGLPEC